MMPVELKCLIGDTGIYLGNSGIDRIEGEERQQLLMQSFA